MQTLLRGLSPAFLRFGGSPADYSMFTEADPIFLKSLGLHPQKRPYGSYSSNKLLYFPLGLFRSHNTDSVFYVCGTCLLSVFYVIKLIISGDDIDKLVGISRNCGLRLLFELNIQLREGSEWNPVNAMALIEYMQSKGYGKEVDFELGNGMFHHKSLKFSVVF